MASISPVVKLTSHNKSVVENVSRLLESCGYSVSPSTEVDLDYLSEDTSLPFINIKQDSKKKTLLIEILGSPWSIVTELTFRYLKEIGVTFRNVNIFNVDNQKEKLFEIESSTYPNIIFAIQQRLADRGMANTEVKLVLLVSSLSIGKKQTSPKPRLKKPKIPIRRIKGIKGKGINPSMISPVMFKRSKLSQLAKRDIPEPEPVLVPPPKPEIPDEWALPILEELEENQRIILKEILKRPTKKVQSNHIAKHTNLEQEIIRDVLRELVNKDLLKVTSGWYVLKRQVDEEA